MKMNKINYEELVRAHSSVKERLDALASDLEDFERDTVYAELSEKFDLENEEEYNALLELQEDDNKIAEYYDRLDEYEEAKANYIAFSEYDYLAEKITEIVYNLKNDPEFVNNLFLAMEAQALARDGIDTKKARYVNNSGKFVNTDFADNELNLEAACYAYLDNDIEYYFKDAVKVFLNIDDGDYYEYYSPVDAILC